MGHKRIFFVVWIPLVFTGYLRGQQVFPHSKLLDFNVPSPNAASLGKFGDIPVNYNVGLPSIKVPIYIYGNQESGLALNISLDYHAGGIRVQEKASNVGLGWALNAGGVITRQIRSGPDEGGMGYTGYWSAPALPNVADYQANENMYGTTVTQVNPYYRYNVGIEDSEPDVFSFNFGGKSGKFIVGKNGDILIYPSQQLKITKLSGSSIFGFTVVTEEGIKYVFDQQENSSTWVGNVKHTNGSAWYVSKIIAPFSTDEINFTYESYISYYNRLFSQSAYKNMMGGSSGSLTGLHSYANSMSFEAKRLTNISLPNGVNINFSYSTVERCDVLGDKALKEILISDGQNTKGFRLNSNYSFSVSTPPPSNCNGYNEETTRLVLHGVTEFSGSKEKAPYVFEYNTSVFLPATNSYSVDHWGFYNGATNNSTLLPYNGTGMGVPPPGVLDNANREANPSFAQAGMIKKVQYPTGGFSEFEFESNTIPSTGGGQFLNKNMTATINGMLPERSTTFTLETSNTTTSFHFEFGGFSPANSNCRIIASITSLDEGTTYVDVTLGPGAGYSKTVSVTIPAGTYKYKYIFESPTSPCVTELFVVALDWVNIIPIPANTSVAVGGLRIKSIKEFDGSAIGAILSRSFDYTVENSAVSSGVLAVKPYYTYNYNDECIGGVGCVPGDEAFCSAQTGAYFVIFSSPLFTLSSAMGNCVLYSRVVEQFTGDGTKNNGKIERTYTTSSTMPQNGFPYDAFNPSFMTAPFITPQSLDWVYGVLLTEKVYDNNSVLKKSLENSYALKANALPSNIKDNFKGIKVFKRRSVWSGCKGQSLSYINFQVNEYFPVIGISQLVSSIEKEYTDYGVVNTRVKSYEYDPTYYQVSKIATQDSKGRIVDQRLYYPYSYTGNAAFTSLVNTHHILSPVVSTEIWQEQPGVPSSRKLMAGQVTEFGTFNTTMVKPVTLYDLKINEPLSETTIGVFNPAQLIRNSTYYRPTVQITSYNAKSKVTGQKKYQDIPHAYIWDSKQVGPIADATNALHNEIFFDSFEEGTGWQTGWLTYDQTQVHAGRWSAKMTAAPGSPAVNLSPQWLTVSHAAPRKYRFSGWVYSDGPTCGIYLFMKTATETGYYTYVDNISTSTTGKWVFLDKEFSVPANISLLNLRIDNNGGGIVWFDDLRLYPSDAKMTSYTYDPLLGITSQADVNNRFIFYEYDLLGRLSLVRNHDGDIVKKICYNYAGQPEDCGLIVYSNVAKSGNFTRNNCGTNGTGGTATYNIAAGTYTSIISQADADQKAVDAVNAGGQAYANANGGCTWTNQAQSGNFTRNNCPANYSGSTVTYNVAANTYSSTISLADANQKAINDINTNGQAYANTNGTCTIVCNSSNCFGDNKKCINGVCETGIQIVVSCEFDSGTGKYRRQWVYQFSDYSWSTYTWSTLTPMVCPE